MDIVLFTPRFFKPLFAALIMCALTAAPAYADTTTSSPGSARVLQEALATHNGLNLYDGKSSGLNFSGGLFSGRASGIDRGAVNYTSDVGAYNTDTTAELEGDARVHALMIDGRYNFDNNFGSNLPLHPYLSSGIGMAMYDHGSSPTTASLASPGGTVPLFRVGGGVTYTLGEQWNMSLDYKAGFSGAGTAAVGNSTATTDMQSINMGMHFKF